MVRNVFDRRDEARMPLAVRLALLLLASAVGICGFAFASQRSGQKKLVGTQYTLKFTLSTSATTSAGVFASDGTLVRTLWGCQPLAGGSYQRTWDGNDDNGNPVAPGTYTAKLLTHNMTVNWDGTIGNSSTYQTGPSHLGGLGGFVDMVGVGSYVYLLRGYNELGEKIDRIDRSIPGIFDPSGVVGLPSAYQPTCFSTDGKRMYVAMLPIWMYTGNPTYIVCAYDLNEVTGAWTFTNIVPVSGTGLGSNDNGEWITLGTTAMPSSIAVQTKGFVLAVAQNSTGLIQFFDKLGGQALPGAESQITVPGVTAIRWSTDEQTLWTATGNDVLGWQFVNGSWVQSTKLAGTSPVRSIAVNPNDGTIAILYAGTDQQVRCYTPAGTWQYTIGSRGGYATSPTVNDTKFFIPKDYFNGEPIGCGLAFQNDEKLWVIDSGNARALRFSVHKHLAAARRDAIVCMVGGYQCTVDKNDATRVFDGYLEFKRDYSQPLSYGEGSAWRLVNNWGYGYLARNTAASTTDGLTEVVTATNGHTYGLMQPADTPAYNHHLVELVPSTGVRDLGLFGDDYLAADMSGWSMFGTGTSKQTVTTHPFTGFTANNPTWGSQSVYCTEPIGNGQPTFDGGYKPTGGMPIDKLPDGSIASFNTTIGATDYNAFYLGYVKPGASDFWVRTARGSEDTPLAHDGSVPIGGIPNMQLVPSIGGRVLGNLVAVFCNGEFFDSGESNQILLYDASGLPVTDFGTRLTLLHNQPAPSGKAGNFYGNAFVMGPDGNPHIFNSDEASHGGIHEWTLLNANTVKVASATFDGTNTANFGVISAIKVSSMTPPLTGPGVTDTFNRSDSATVGDGWADPNGCFEIKGGRLKLVPGLYNADTAAALLRPDIAADSDQTVSVPAQYFDDTKMFTSPNTVAGTWGVFSHYQTDGARYFMEFAYWRYPGDTSPGLGEVYIGMIVNGVKYVLGYDHCLNLPPNPGHNYSIELQTTGIGPTHLHGVVRDATTGTIYVTIDQVSDEPELQHPGQIGIQAAYANNEFTGYTASWTTGAPRRSALQRVP